MLSPDTYLRSLASETPRRYTFDATDVAGARAWQQEFRPVLRETLGLNRIAARGRATSDALLLGTDQRADHVREEWRLETEPGHWLDYYLLRPLGPPQARALVLCPHGHGGQARREYVGAYASSDDQRRIESEELNVALQAVREGYIALAPDMRGFAGRRLREDIEQGADHSCRPLAMRALMLGRTLLGERVWDMQRLLDWALAREEVASHAVIVTGNSRGGTVTLFLSEVDERVGICVPVCYYCTFEASIGSIKHCECNYIPGILETAEMYEVAALIAPRPFLAVNGVQDPIFPINAVRESYARLRKVYELFDASDSCALHEGPDGHRYYKDLVWPWVKTALQVTQRS